ncbi:MAG: hypothetical protein ACOYMN_13715, partial [Roseimicrobium sp.]
MNTGEGCSWELTATLTVCCAVDGPHWIRAAAVDAGGNVDSNAPRLNWTLDTQPPAVWLRPGQALPASPTSQKTLHFELGWSDAG